MRPEPREHPSGDRVGRNPDLEEAKIEHRRRRIRGRKWMKQHKSEIARVPGSESDAPGRRAEHPWRIPPRGWGQILRRSWGEIGRDHVSLLAAGSAYYAMLAIFPLLIAVVTIYGLVADPADVQHVLSSTARVIPGNVQQILEQQLIQIASGTSKSLGWGVVLSLIGLLWSASSGMAALLKAVNIAYDEEDTRSFVPLRLLAIAFAVGGIVLVLVSVGFITVLPALVHGAGLGEWATWIRWPILGVLFILALAFLYRYGSDRNPPQWQWVSWGAVIAAVLWLAASYGFSYYIANFGNYNKTYGTLGAVIVLMVWLYLSSFVILLGAEINSEMEHQTEMDTTVGRPLPMGERGAWVADHLPGDERRGWRRHSDR
jgi:membrane protein